MPRRGVTLLEVVISAAILMVVVGIAYGLLFSVQRRAASGAVLQQVTQEPRRIVELLGNELRDLNFTATDMVPSTPAGSSTLSYRRVVGFDAMNDTPTLSPSRASGQFRSLSYDGANQRILLTTPSTGAVTIARHVSDLSFTLDPPNKLLIDLGVEVTDDEGQPVQGRAQLVLAMRNKLP